jgi:O-antigen ligase
VPAARRTAELTRATLLLSPVVMLLGPAIAVLVAMAADRGGFAVTTWTPAALFLIGLLVVGGLTLGAEVPRVVWIAVAAIAAYAAWSYASIAWADSKADAWDGANRTLLYAAVFALFALWRLRAAAAATLLGALAAGIAGLAAVELVRAGASADPRDFFLEGQFVAPTSYANASVALWTSMLWPSVALASRREAPVAARALMGAAAVVLGAVALLGQSRGWLFATPPTALFFVLVMPQRVRLALTMLVVVFAELAISRPLLHVYDASATPGLGDATASAARATLIAAAAVAALVGVAALLERARPRPSPATARRSGYALLACSIVAAAVVGGVFVAKEGSPFTKVADGWRTFKSQSSPTGHGSRFGQSLGSNRYDFWRVAWARFEDRPLVGIGADNFQEDYLAQGRSGEQPRYPHSVELRALSQTGLIGAALLVVGVGSACLAAAGAIRRRSGIGAATAAAALTACVSWAVHGSVDWFWEFAGLGAPAFAALGLAAGLVPRRPGRGRSLARGPAIALAAGAVLAALSLAGPWLAQRDVDGAVRGWAQGPARAFDRLDRAASLNPLSPLPDVVAGSIAVRMERWADAERYFRDSQARDRRNQFAELELGLLAARAGHRREAEARLARAVALSPRDRITRAALARLRAGRAVKIADVNRQLAQHTRDLGR